MSEMIDFGTIMLQALAEFFVTPPIFYLFALVCLCFIVRIIKIIIS